MYDDDDDDDADGMNACRCGNPEQEEQAEALEYSPTFRGSWRHANLPQFDSCPSGRYFQHVRCKM